MLALIIIATQSFFVLTAGNDELYPRPPFQINKEVPHALPEHESYIPREYLIKLKNKIITRKSQKDDFVQALTTKYNTEVKQEYSFSSHTILAVTVDDNQASALENLPEIEIMSQNQIVQITDNDDQCMERNHPYTWGLDRIDQRHKVQVTAFDETATYTYGENDSGAGVEVYVVDSGIMTSHSEFEGRAKWGFTASGMDGSSDLNGHGTHVAGTVGSKCCGVAKNATLVAVKVLNEQGTGTSTSTLEGLFYVLKDHQARYETQKRMPKSVCNLSLGSAGIDRIKAFVVNELILNGITVVAAAGNSDIDACYFTPAHVPDAITVGASDLQDKTTTFTNWGTCVDIFAPGHDILSTYPTQLLPQGYKALQGTSMAAPHVSGVVARYLSTLDETPTPQEVSSWLTNQATKDILTFRNSSHATSPNKLLFQSCDPALVGEAPVLRFTRQSVIFILVMQLMML